MLVLTTNYPAGLDYEATAPIAQAHIQAPGFFEYRLRRSEMILEIVQR